jgi:hypothetical protein
MSVHRFTTKVEAAGPGEAWCFVRLPAKVTAALGTKGRISVRLTAGATLFRTSVFPDGKGGHHAMFNKAMQAAAGKAAGDDVALTLDVDRSPRIVKVPKDLRDALAASPRIEAFFDGLAPSCRAEYVGFVIEAKKPDTRAARIDKALDMLQKGKKRVK